MNARHHRGRVPTGLWRRIWFGLVTVMALTGALPAHADWTLLNSGTSLDLYGVDAVGATTAYVVGERGTILKTTDGGASWTKLRTGLRATLGRVQFLDVNNGYVLGGGLHRTRYGGVSWQTLALPASEGISGMYFVNTELGFLISRGTVFKTADGGLTWSAVRVGDFDIMELQFDATGTIGYAGGTDWGSGYVYKSVDGGSTWVQQLWLGGGMVTGLHFPVDTGLGYFTNVTTEGAEPGVYKTTDGGATWTRTGVGPASDGPVMVHFASAQAGVALGYRGTIFYTADGGASWTEGWLGRDVTPTDFDFGDAATGYLVGRGGLLARTVDGGMPSIRATFLHPVGAGSVNGFSEYTGCYAPYDCANDQPANAPAGAPLVLDSRDYLADSAGNRVLFALGDGLIPATHRVVGLRVYLAPTQWTGPMASLGYQRIGIDAAPVDSPAFWVANYWIVGWSGWSWTGLNWTAADVNALEIGVKSVAGERLEAAQVFVKIYHEPAP